MGWLIVYSRKLVEYFAKNNINHLRIGGWFITFSLVVLSGAIGWIIEQLSMVDNNAISLLGSIMLLIALTSSIATRSLFESSQRVITSLPQGEFQNNLKEARNKLSYIVGRDVENLDRDDILRAVAESASENSVDGIFAPIFWMVIGIIFWELSPLLPGPLTFAWIYKASSTLDSMIGYKEGRLRWLGYAGAKLDDFMTWAPCRLVLITLPLITRPWHQAPKLIKAAWIDGSKDESPNSGLSEAIFAHCLGIRMGGENIYRAKKRTKSIIAQDSPKANQQSTKRILNSIVKLQALWITLIIVLTSQINFQSYQ